MILLHPVHRGAKLRKDPSPRHARTRGSIIRRRHRAPLSGTRMHWSVLALRHCSQLQLTTNLRTKPTLVTKSRRQRHIKSPSTPVRSLDDPYHSRERIQHPAATFTEPSARNAAFYPPPIDRSLRNDRPRRCQVLEASGWSDSLRRHDIDSVGGFWGYAEAQRPDFISNTIDARRK